MSGVRDIAFTLLLVAAIPVGLASSSSALAFWYWISLFQPHTQSFGFATSVPFGPIAAGVTLLSWLFSPERKLPPATPIVVCLYLLGVWITLTTFLASTFPQSAIENWEIFIKQLLMVIVGISIVQTRHRLNVLIWSVCLAVGYYGFKLGIFAVLGGDSASYRGPSYMNQNNGLARAMLLYVPLVAHLFLHYKQLWIRLGLATVGGSSTVALVASGSRGAWIAALAMICIALLRMRGRAFLWLPLMGFVGLVTLLVIPESLVHRFQTIGDYDTDASFQGRAGAWDYAISQFLQRPIMGGGFLVFELEYGKAAHSSFFQMLGEHGVIGLVLFVTLLCACAFATRSVRLRTKGYPDLAWAENLAYLLQLSLVGYAVGSLTISHAHFPILYGIIGILASLQIIVRRELQAAALQRGVHTESATVGRREQKVPPEFPPMR